MGKPARQLAPDVAALAESIVTRIRHATRVRALEHALDVGAIVTEGVYDGNLAALRERGEDDALYRQVAGHQELPFSAKTLWTYVKVYELVRTFPKLRDGKHLGVAHLRALVNLPQGIQERLLRAAETELWTSARLEQETQVHKRTPSNIGRPPTESFLRGIRRVEKLTAELEQEIAPRVHGRLGRERVATVRSLLRETRAHIEALEARLEKDVVDTFRV